MKAPSLTLSQRLLLLTAVALLPALAILGFNEFTLRKTREAEVHAYALRISELAALEMQRILTGAGALMVAAANAPVVQTGGAECQGYMDRLGALLPQVMVINITDMEGNSLCSNSRDADDLRPAESTSVREALKTEFFRVGEYIETSRGPGLLLGTRRTAPDGSELGYVLAAIGLDYLGAVLKDRPNVSGGRAAARTICWHADSRDLPAAATGTHPRYAAGHERRHRADRRLPAGQPEAGTLCQRRTAAGRQHGPGQ
jgi:hypothetical protein